MRSADRMARRVLIFVVVAVMLPLQTLADDAAIYESLSDVPIGRVFFSPQQRVFLDKRRHTPENLQPATSADRSKTVSPDAAGYIVSGSGKKRVYADGEFVDVANSAVVKFPGDVRVVREPKASEDSADASD